MLHALHQQTHADDSNQNHYIRYDVQHINIPELDGSAPVRLALLCFMADIMAAMLSLMTLLAVWVLLICICCWPALPEEPGLLRIETAEGSDADLSMVFIPFAACDAPEARIRRSCLEL